MVLGRLWSLTLVVVLGLGDTVVLARQTQVPQVEAARQAYWEGRFEQSIEQLEPLLDKLKNRFDSRETAFLLGLNYFALGEGSKGRAAFATAVQQDPAFTPDDDIYPPDIIQTYVGVRADLVGELHVKSEPSGARVLVAGRLLGKTPFKGDALAGEQSVQAQLDGYTGQVRRVQIKAGVVTPVLFKLNRVAAGRELPADEFQKVKLVVQDGEKTKETDSILVLDRSRLAVLAKEGGSELKTLFYKDIKSAEYSYSKHPRWKEGLGATIAVGIFAAPLFFLKGKKHWLTLQTENDYVVLRLDKRNYSLVRLSFETHSGITVETVGEN
jgi:hypothetical protein